MRRAQVVDLAMGSVVAGVSVGNVFALEDPTGGLAANLPYPLAAGALVLVRRRHPIGASAAFVAASLAQAALLVSPSEMAGAFLGLLIFPFTAAAHTGGPRAVGVLAACVGLFLAVEILADTLVLDEVAFPFMLCTASFLAGRGVRTRTELAAELHEAAVRAEEAREAEAEAAIAAERRRIARELHDVVAHSISVMVVQAGGARRIIDRDRERAIEAAERIERTGRDALVEMRRLLGVLHAADEGGVRTPQPGLGSLERLVRDARDAGLPVSLHVDGERRPLPAGLELTVYRIIQEGLTNVMKHAGSAATRVELRWFPEALEVTVADEGAPAGRPSMAGGGHGIVGMRERARLYGGEVRAGRRDGGGFEVRARLPLVAEEVPA